MSWGLGWKRPSDVFHLTLSYGEDEALDESTPTSSRSSSSTSVHTSPFSPSPPSPAAEGQEENNQEELLGFRVDLDWNVGDDEDQVALKLQSQVMVALPSPQDTVEVEFKDKKENENAAEEDMGEVAVEMRVVKRREPLKGAALISVSSPSFLSSSDSQSPEVVAPSFGLNKSKESSGDKVPALLFSSSFPLSGLKPESSSSLSNPAFGLAGASLELFESDNSQKDGKSNEKLEPLLSGLSPSPLFAAPSSTSTFSNGQFAPSPAISATSLLASSNSPKDVQSYSSSEVAHSTSISAAVGGGLFGFAAASSVSTEPLTKSGPSEVPSMVSTLSTASTADNADLSVVSLVILLVNAECEEVQVLVNVEVVVPLDIGGVQVMVTGVIVLVDVPPGAEACHLVAVVIADLHIVEEMKFLTPMEMVSGTESEAGAERRS